MSVGRRERVAPFADGIPIGRFGTRTAARRAVASAFWRADPVVHGEAARGRWAAWSRPCVPMSGEHHLCAALAARQLAAAR